MAKIIDINGLYDQYYKGQDELRRIVFVHSEQVAKKALSILTDRQLPANREFVYCASMLHDIGVVACYAPDIHAVGNLPYICHGIEGRKILEKNDLPLSAMVCERHTGSGITKEQIIEQKLPLPPRDMLPVSIEEKVICYADKFFSKSKNLYEEKPLELIINQMKKHGEESLKRFMELHSLFS